MLIGISTRDRRDFWTLSSFPPREAVIYDAELPLEVEKAINFVRENLNLDESKIPIAVQSFHGHGGDYGLDFRENYFQDVELNPTTSISKFTTKNLVARISFGMNPTKNLKEGGNETVYRDISSLKRLHLNVFGARQFLPENFKEIQKERNRFEYSVEKMHFSIRWLDGKFDGVWNDFSEFEEHKDSRYLNHPRFNRMRTTYMYSRKSSDHVNGTFNRKIGGKDEITLKDVYDMLGTKEKILPPNMAREEILSKFSKDFSEKELDKIISSEGISYTRRDSFEIIGYKPTLEVLSGFGNVLPSDEQRIIKINMEEGVDYIFNNVLPAMKNYVDS